MSLRDILDFFNSRRFKRHDKLYLRKRSIFMVCGCLLILYLISIMFRRFGVTKLEKEDLTTRCIDMFLRSLETEIQESDSYVWIPTASPDPLVENNDPASIDPMTKNSFVPLVGNGRFAISPVSETENGNKFYIRGRRILNIPILFDPIVKIGEFGTHTKTAFVSRYLKGTFEKITCANYGGDVVSIHETFTAHRLIPVLFTQDIRVSNPTNAPLILNLSRKGWLNKSVGAIAKPISVTTKDHREYSIITARSQSRAQAIAIAYSSLHDTVEVHPNDRYSLVLHTFLNYSNVFKHESEMQAAIPDLKVSLRDAVQKIVDFSDTALQQYHEHAWQSLWYSGFSISHSHAPDAVNGDRINATIYYMLCQRPMLLPSPNKSSLTSSSVLDNISSELMSYVEIQSIKSLQYKPDRCYHGHSTFQASRLWDRLDSINNLQRVISLWFLTLEKLSCEHLIQSSAKEVLQAVLLSLAGLRFAPRHLEFHSHPNDLQRSFLIRRLLYDDGTPINISVIINEDNKAVMRVSVANQNPNGKDFFACDAGCLDAPIHLSSNPSEFPVKLTDPLTPLLYITSDREHLQELKHSIHVKEIGEAPAHEHQTIALHRYGHSLGGLPGFFWITMIFLIIVFHLFLGKLIYNEYFNTNNVPYERTSYRNIGRYSM